MDCYDAMIARHRAWTKGTALDFERDRQPDEKVRESDLLKTEREGPGERPVERSAIATKRRVVK